jgi:signal transduction histidine kinase
MMISVSGEPIYADGRQIGGVIRVRDIDVEFANREKLAHQTQLMIRMFDAMPFPVFWKDAQLKYQLCNTAFAQTAGYVRPDRLIGKTDLELKWEQGEARRYHTGDKHVLFSRESTINESITFSDRGGKQKYFLQSKIPLVSDRDETLGLFGIYVDVTPVRELESELQSARKLESVGQLAAGIAHEINTPTQFTRDNINYLADVTGDLFALCESLQSLVENAKAAGRGTLEIEPIAELLREVDVEFAMEEVPLALAQAREGTTRISEIVSAMKEFSHPGKEKSFIDINRAIATSCTVARNEWKYCADMQYHFDEELPDIECCQGEINQVIVNLVVNAAHAIAAKNAGETTMGTITISTKRQERFVAIDIADNGVGMTEDTKNRVFEPFFTTKDVGKGTGQGMTIAYDVIVNKHNGTLTVDSVCGEGTRVHILIPIEASPQ